MINFDWGKLAEWARIKTSYDWSEEYRDYKPHRRLWYEERPHAIVHYHELDPPTMSIFVNLDFPWDEDTLRSICQRALIAGELDYEIESIRRQAPFHIYTNHGGNPWFDVELKNVEGAL